MENSWTHSNLRQLAQKAPEDSRATWSSSSTSQPLKKPTSSSSLPRQLSSLTQEMEAFHFNEAKSTNERVRPASNKFRSKYPTDLGPLQKSTPVPKNAIVQEQVNALVTRADEILRKEEGFIAQQNQQYYGKDAPQTQAQRCPVCLGEDVDTKLLPCCHYAHAACMKRWILTQVTEDAGLFMCPLCRDVLQNMDSINRVGLNELDDFSPRTESGTIECSSQASWKSTPTECSETTTIWDLMMKDHQVSREETEKDEMEWGWFEDFEEQTVASEVSQPLLLSPENQSMEASDVSAKSSPHTYCLERVESEREVRKTFPPLHPEYDLLYADCSYEWLRSLPSSNYVMARIEVKRFRIVQTAGIFDKHAEFLITLQLDHITISRWKRYSAIQNFVRRLSNTHFRKSILEWKSVVDMSGWFRQLDLPYLHHKCKLIETFAHSLLFEATSVYPLAELMEC